MKKIIIIAKSIAVPAAWVIMAIVIITSSFFFSASFLGWHFDVVQTGSMEPKMMPGGMVISHPITPEDIRVGDIILFQEPETGAPVCHRVIDIEENNGELFFQTKGDANAYTDTNPISRKDIIGKTTLYVPQVGKLAYLSHLYQPIVLGGVKVSLAVLITVALVLSIIFVESRNILEWLMNPTTKKYKERLKIWQERLAKQRKAFHIG